MIAAVSTFVFASMLTGAPWTLLLDEDGIQVRRRPGPDGRPVEIEGTTVIDAPMENLIALLFNAELKPNWVRYCATEQMLAWEASGNRVSYLRMSSPVPGVADRDAVVRWRLSRWKRGVRVHFDSIEHPRDPGSDGAIRIPDLKGVWTFEPVSPTRTKVTQLSSSSPGGWVPEWLVNIVAHQFPARTLEAMKTQVTKAGYDVELRFVTRKLSTLRPKTAAISKSGAKIARAEVRPPR